MRRAPSLSEMPRAAAAASAVVTPGMIVHGTPAARGFDLVVSAAEHAGIAPLQPHDRLAFACEINQHVRDLVLYDRAAGTALAHVYTSRLSPREFQDGGRR